MKRALPVALAVSLAIAGVAACDVDDPGISLLVPRDEVALAFGDPDDCAECHEQHVNEWEISNHAYAAKDPVFIAMVDLGQRQSEGKLDQFCVQCHTPVGMASGQTEVVLDEERGVFVQDLSRLDPISERGVSCDVCHSLTQVMEPFNAKGVYTPDGVRRGTIEDPVPNDAHQSAYSPLHEESEMCGMCHAVVNPKDALVEETFPEWAASSFAAEGVTCQDCHMPEYEGQAAKDGPTRTVHRHTFIGVDVSLLPEDEFPGYHEMRAMTRQLLQESAELDAWFDAGSNRLEMSIENLAGHALPSGATAERQMWIRVSIVDTATGAVVFESGMLDELHDVRVGNPEQTTMPGDDPQLIYYGQQLIAIPGLADLDDEGKAAARASADSQCVPMGLGAVAEGSGLERVSFPWQANWQCNYMIPADGIDYPGYDLATLEPGDYQAELTLRFRSFPPYFLRKLEQQADLDPEVKGRVPIVDMEQMVVDFSIL